LWTCSCSLCSQEGASNYWSGVSTSYCTRANCLKPLGYPFRCSFLIAHCKPRMLNQSVDFCTCGSKCSPRPVQKVPQMFIFPMDCLNYIYCVKDCCP
jgi:hypothetical protein